MSLDYKIEVLKKKKQLIRKYGKDKFNSSIFGIFFTGDSNYNLPIKINKNKKAIAIYIPYSINEKRKNDYYSFDDLIVVDIRSVAVEIIKGDSSYYEWLIYENHNHWINPIYKEQYGYFTMNRGGILEINPRAYTLFIANSAKYSAQMYKGIKVNSFLINAIYKSYIIKQYINDNSIALYLPKNDYWYEICKQVPSLSIEDKMRIADQIITTMKSYLSTEDRLYIPPNQKRVDWLKKEIEETIKRREYYDSCGVYFL